jgi:membrane protein
MPNTKVRWLPGFTGGTIAALLFIGWLWLCAALQIGVAGYGKIYGSFAVVPILIAWLFVSWEIVFLGAEVAFAVQNCTTYQMEQSARGASMEARTLLALSVLVETARALGGKARNFETAAYARERRVPVRFLNEVVEELVQGGWLGRLAGDEGRFVLLKAPEALTVQEVVAGVMQSGVRPEDVGLNKADTAVQEAVAGLSGGIRSAVGKTTIADLLPK